MRTNSGAKYLRKETGFAEALIEKAAGLLRMVSDLLRIAIATRFEPSAEYATIITTRLDHSLKSLERPRDTLNQVREVSAFCAARFLF
jgi:hypothetical protein